MRVTGKLAVSLFPVLFLPAFALGQSSCAIAGEVVDPSGALLQKIDLTLANLATGAAQHARTDDSGHFQFTVPGPGTYRIASDTPHFQSYSENTSVDCRSTVSLKVQLQIAPANESVSVIARETRDTDYAVSNNTTAAKIDAPLLLTPQSIQVVPRAVIQDQKTLTLSDATRNVAGVATDFSFNGSSEPLLILRGFQTISMTAQGSMSGAESYYLDGTKVQGVPVNMANVQSVEVIKGPETVLYGRAEPGGMVNVVRRPLETTPSFALEQTGSDYWTTRTLGEASSPLNATGTVLGRLAGSWLQNRSNRDFVRDRVGALTADASWRPTGGDRVSLFIDYTSQNYRNDYGIPANLATRRPYDLPWHRQFNDSPDLSYMRPVSALLEASHSFNENWSVNGRAAIIVSDTHEVDVTPYRYDLTTGADCLATTGDLCRYYYYARPNGQYRLNQQNIELHGDVHTGPLRNQFLIGGDFYHSEKNGTLYLEQLSSVNIFNPVFPPVPRLDPNLSIPLDNLDKNDWNSGFVQDNLSIGARFHAVAAVRLDGSSAIYAAPGTPPNKDFFASPRAGAVYQLATGHALYGQYQEAVDANNGRQPTTGLALAAERSRQFEGGYKYSAPGGAWNATLALYQLTKRNRADYSLYPIISTVGEARSRGVELDMLGRLTPHLATMLSYAYTEAVVTVDPIFKGTFLADVPRHGGSVWARYSFNDHWAAGAGIFSQSARQGDQGNDFLLPGYAREDAMVAYNFNLGGLHNSLQVNADNVLNRHYFSGSHQFVQDWIQPGAPRTVLITLRIGH